MRQVPTFRTDPEVARQAGRAVAQRRVQDCVARLQRMLIGPDTIVTTLRREARYIRRVTAKIQRAELAPAAPRVSPTWHGCWARRA
jgi:hypothetical protein